MTVSDNWTTDDFDLSALAGKTMYGIKLYFENDKDLKGYQFNLGQLTISNNQDAPQAPTTVAVAKQVLKMPKKRKQLCNLKATRMQISMKFTKRWRQLEITNWFIFLQRFYLPKLAVQQVLRVQLKN